MERYAYLAGPMTGIEMFNFPLFIRMAMVLRSCGWFVENPAEYDIASGIDPKKPEEEQPKSRQELLREDFHLITGKCRVIIFLPNWWKSEGARAEFLVGTLSGLPTFEIVHTNDKPSQHCDVGEWIELNEEWSLFPIASKPGVVLS